MSTALRTKSEISHPGVVLKKRFIDRYGITITEAAEKMHMERAQLSRFINGHTSISRNLAIKLHNTTGVSANYWINRQFDYDLQKMSDVELRKLDTEPLVVGA